MEFARWTALPLALFLLGAAPIKSSPAPEIAAEMAPEIAAVDFECEFTTTPTFCGGCAGYAVTEVVNSDSGEWCSGCTYTAHITVTAPGGGETHFTALSQIGGMECDTRRGFTLNCPIGNGTGCAYWYALIFECGECPI